MNDMSRAQIPLGVFADDGDDVAELVEFVTRRVTRRFFASMNLGDGEE